MFPAYGSRFHADNHAAARRSAALVVPLLADALSIRSVVDVGCGRGAWLEAFLRQGAQDILGIDNHNLEERQLSIPASAFQRHDLSRPFTTGRKFDLVVSLEVAEHLPKASAVSFVSSLAG